MTRPECGTSYFGVRDPEHVRTDLERLQDQGLNAVLHTFSERDQLYYHETMSEIVDASHELGFDVYVNPWGVGRVFGGEALSEFIGRNPEACQVLSSGDRIPAACFNNPEFREFMRDWTQDAVNIGADVVFWDEPHWFIPGWHEESYPDDARACYCDACRQQYKHQYGAELSNGDPDDVAAFREESLLDFLQEMMAIVREGGSENAVCLLPGSGHESGIDDWERLARADNLDVFATDPYWFGHGEDAKEFVGEYTEKVTSLAADYGLRSQIWIQGFKLDDDPATITEVRTATETALEGGVDSVFMWGWDGCRIISDIACDNPAQVWEAYLDTLKTVTDSMSPN
ncbi:hypothetical protein [Halorussus salinus]|uniref:hypothetical protein n=1 Tax=Halorussus salinus TaxID=1364935 RepID=UPI001091C31E|nr:hypothetical protein [Halorussus salinus]